MPVNFPFTFSFNVPGLTNPFVPPPQTPTRRPNTRDDERIRSRTVNTTAPLPTEDKFQRRRPIPSPSRTPLPPLSRKRAWDPAFASPSESAATLASTSGYIDTPAKYRAMAAQQTRATISRDDFHQVEYVDEDAVAGEFLISAEDKPFRREVFHAHAGYTCLSYTNSRVGEHVYKIFDIHQLPHPFIPPISAIQPRIQLFHQSYLQPTFFILLAPLSPVDHDLLIQSFDRPPRRTPAC